MLLTAAADKEKGLDAANERLREQLMSDKDEIGELVLQTDQLHLLLAGIAQHHNKHTAERHIQTRYFAEEIQELQVLCE